MGEINFPRIFQGGKDFVDILNYTRLGEIWKERKMADDGLEGRMKFKMAVILIFANSQFFIFNDSLIFKKCRLLLYFLGFFFEKKMTFKVWNA